MADTPAASLPPGWPAMTLAQAHAALTAPGSPFEMTTAVVHGREIRTWKNAPPTLREVFQVGSTFGERIFVVLDDDRITYEAFTNATLALAKRLQDDGVKKGDRVAIVMRNLPEWPVAFFAAVLVGAIATPLNAWWTGEELAYGLKDSGATLALFDMERFNRIAPLLETLPDLKRIYITRTPLLPPSDKLARLESVVGSPREWASLSPGTLPDVPLAPDDDVSIFYTSGTTGNPKGAVQSHRNAICAIFAPQFSAARAFLRRGEPLPPPDPNLQRSALLSVPFFHTTGCHAILCPTVATGGKIVMQRRFEPAAAMALIQREKITSAGGVPAIAWQILEHPDRAQYDLSSLESIAYGGAPAAPELVRRLKEVFPKSTPGIGWGMTETTSTFSSNTAEDYVARPESSGPALPVCDMKVVDAAGAALPVGEIGELLVRGPNVVRGYWRKPEANAATFVDGWLKTGDLARLDDDGFVYIVDRKKDMLIRGGENIYCIEVEDALYRHPAIMDAAVIGLPHRILGEEPAAVVTLKPDRAATEQEIRDFVATKIAAFKVPVRVVILHESLPRNANGKIMKTKLRGYFG
jgi:long-chain acyl-CoA synthetase